jgi:hypothetical protein
METSMKINLRNFVDVFNSSFRSTDMIENSTSVRPSIFTAFISPSTLDVTASRFSIRSTHAFWAPADWVDTGPATMKHTAQRKLLVN